MATVLDALIEPALKELGVLGASETATAGEAADALAALNRMVDAWPAETLLNVSFKEPTKTFTMTASVATYGVGPTGGVVLTVRPPTIAHVTVIDTAATPDIEYPLTELTDDQWAAIPQKLLTSTMPQAWYYNPTFPDGTLHLYPVPTGANLQGAIYAQDPTVVFAATSTTVSLPPGYLRMIVKNLALELAPSYGREVSPVLFKQAAESMATVKRQNTRPADMEFEAAALCQRGGGYNIYTDS